MCGQIGDVEAHIISADIVIVRVDLIVDGTDNFHTRFILNDYSIKYSLPWIFAGVVGAEAQLMPVIPSMTACLRCVFDAPPPPCSDPTCRETGVLGPAGIGEIIQDIQQLNSGGYEVI